MSDAAPRRARLVGLMADRDAYTNTADRRLRVGQSASKLAKLVLACHVAPCPPSQRKKSRRLAAARPPPYARPSAQPHNAAVTPLPARRVA